MNLVKSVAAILLACVTLLSPVAASAASPRVETLVGGTLVPVHINGSLSSASANVGDVFTVEAADDVVVNGRIVVRKGAQGEGRIASVQRARGSGHSGAIGLHFTWIFSADGGRIHLSESGQNHAEEDRKGASSTATIIGLATFGLGGLFGHNFAKGRDVTLDEHKTLSAYVASNARITTTEEAKSYRNDRFNN